jgi:chorismate dehydratase
VRLGVVKFLNARPLIDGLDTLPDVSCVFDVPSALPDYLARGDVDAALIPVIDVLRDHERYTVVSDACIACDGPTMTVRVFSRMPPDRILSLAADTDSHTSVALARVLWRELFGRDLDIRPLDAVADQPTTDGILLIGDKVVDPHRVWFGYEIDLGAAWKELTGLPFVFALWARRSDADPTRLEQLDLILRAARDRGVARAAHIAATHGAARGWPQVQAERYLTDFLRFRLEPRFFDGINHFARLCAVSDLVPIGAQVLPGETASPTPPEVRA